MIIYPAIDIYEGKAVRLKRGDYAQMTVYNNNPSEVAKGFKESGATAIHVVDLEGARDGKPANFDVIKNIVNATGLLIQVGGGIRNETTIKQYLDIGVSRVILGTAAVSAPGFLKEMVDTYSETIAVGVDIKDGVAAIKGWTEISDKDAQSFCNTVQELGVQTIICTDISKDGILAGTNIELYETLKEQLDINIIASGGVSTLDDVKALTKLEIHGAIIGKALYTGDIDLKKAIQVAK
jgi:phosphoribosylformimino-5-aminoimidazole carboxamide ribotide isomerase